MMRFIFLPSIITVIVDIVAWMAIHLAIGFTCSQIPHSWFNPQQWLYKTFPWENNGEIYQRFFKVRSWNHHIPAGVVFREGHKIADGFTAAKDGAPAVKSESHAAVGRSAMFECLKEETES